MTSESKISVENKTTGMIFFIAFLRALAACFITNAHYTGIYPTDLIANGGLIGDVLFFAVSGYCLYNIRYRLSPVGFTKWYGKRIWRVYPPVLIMTAIFMLLGAYSLAEHNALWWYIYPTYYHFVASIIILYIPFYFIMKIDWLKSRLVPIMVVIAVAWMVVYWTVYDRSYYHIDTVREPMIRFLFMESMLLGAWFRQNDVKMRNKPRVVYYVFAIVSFGGYFASKVLFSKRSALAPYQFINQVAIFLLLYCMFRSFGGLDNKLEKMPSWLKKIVRFLSEMTLEIYVVQYVIIRVIRDRAIAFPINWIILTGSILLSAFLLHTVCKFMYTAVDKLMEEKK